MTTIEEKRRFGGETAATELLIAAQVGVVEVSVVGDTVGSFGVREQCRARDVAVVDGRAAVATAEDVLVAGDEGFEATGFGPAVAVGGDFLAAGPEGRVARLEGDEWVDIGTAGAVRAIDGHLIAAADGVYRAGDRLEPVGLDDAYDVATAGPFAATATGLYRLGNGWLAERDCDTRAVAARDDRGHAATPDALYARRDGWERVSLPVEGRVVDIAHGPAVYAVTEAGTVLVEAGDGWRSRALGVDGASALVVVEAS